MALVVFLQSAAAWPFPFSPILQGKLLKRFLPVSLIGGNKAAETEIRTGFGCSIVFLATSTTFFYRVSFADIPCFCHFIKVILTTACQSC